MKIYDTDLEAQQTFMDEIHWFFKELLNEFWESSLSFSELIQIYHSKLPRSIPNDLKRSLSDYYGVENFLGGGYYPIKYCSVKIINDLKPLLSQFFEEELFKLGHHDIKLWASGVLYNYRSKHENITHRDLNQSSLLNEIKTEIRVILVDEFRNSIINLSKEALFKENIKHLCKEEQSSLECQLVWDNFLKSIDSNFSYFVKASFHKLTYVDKTLLIFIIWYYFPKIKPLPKIETNKPYKNEYEFTNEKLSASDNDMLLDIMANKYLEIYEQCNIDFFHLFKN